MRLGRRAVYGAALLAVATAVLLVAGVGWAAEQRADGRIERAVHSWVLGHHWIFDLARIATYAGSGLVVTGLTLLLAATLLVLGRRRAVLFVLLVRVVTGLGDDALKSAIDRARPVLVHPLATAGGSSLPSGHAFGTAGLWASGAIVATGVLGVSARALIAVVVPVLVATTRVLLGVHFVTDVVAGLALGWAATLLLAGLVGMPSSTTRVAPSDGCTRDDEGLH